MIEQIHTGIPLIKRISRVANKTCAYFLKSYLPLRTETEDLFKYHVTDVINESKPESGTYYFGILFGERTVITTFKSSDQLQIKAEGK